MGHIGAREVRFEVLPTAAQPRQDQPGEGSLPRDAPKQVERERLTARAEPARS